MSTEIAELKEGLIEWHRVGPFKIPGVEPYPPHERQMLIELSFGAVLLIIGLDGETADLAPRMDWAHCLRVGGPQTGALGVGGFLRITAPARMESD